MKLFYGGVQRAHGWGFRVWLLAFSTGQWEWYVLANPSSHVLSLFLSPSLLFVCTLLVFTRNFYDAHLNIAGFINTHNWTLALRCSIAMSSFYSECSDQLKAAPTICQWLCSSQTCFHHRCLLCKWKWGRFEHDIYISAWSQTIFTILIRTMKDRAVVFYMQGTVKWNKRLLKDRYDRRLTENSFALVLSSCACLVSATVQSKVLTEDILLKLVCQTLIRYHCVFPTALTSYMSQIRQETRWSDESPPRKPKK